ncbi:unnamed protein product [Discosporangium mesarthrocarpum]
MRFKLLSLVAIAGISGFVANQFYKPESNIKIQHYSPRADVNQMQQNAHEGAAAYIASIRGDYNTGIVDQKLVAKAAEQVRESASRAGGIGLEFEFMGPNNVGGRTRGLLVDRNNSEKLYAAAVTGGIYISINGGNNWVKSFRHRTNNISCLTQDASSKLWAGTGSDWEGVSNQKAQGGGAPAGVGYGIYVSTDEGASWELDPNTTAFGNVTAIKAHPTDANTIAAATSQGLMITTDGGTTWSNTSACVPPGSNAHRNAIDVDWSSDGENVYAAFRSGWFFYGSDYTTACALSSVQGVGLTGNRWSIAASPTNPDRIYALISQGGGYNNLKWTTDGGATWTNFNPPMPVSAPHFDLFGDNGGGQAEYDLLFEAVPRVGDPDNDNLFVGGVDLWRFDGNWTQAATRGSSGSSGESFRVHVDHHIMTFDPNDPSKLYFGNDGGLYKSLDGGYMFYEINKGYSTTQLYSMDIAKYDYVIGGTQDNGNLFVTPWRPGNPDYSASVHNQGVVNGDGFDAAVSNIADIKYTSAQYGNMGRGGITSPQGSGACTPYCGFSSFYTNLAMWEKIDDVSSKDSILFVVDTTEQNIGLGTGNRTTFEGQLTTEQASALIVSGSIRIGTVRTMLVYDGNGGFIGDGQGTLDESDYSFTITFNDAPQLNARVNAFFTTNYNAGSIISVPSATEEIPIEHVLNTNLVPGDQIMIQDPIQSVIAMQTGRRCNVGSDGSTSCQTSNLASGIVLARKAIVLGQNPEWIHLKLGQIQEFTFSDNGDEIYYNISGNQVRMIKGINDIYTQEDADKLSGTTDWQNPNNHPTKVVFNAAAGNVTSINTNPQDPNQLLVSVGNYGVVNHVYLLNRVPNTDNFVPTNITGNLPDIPVYDAIFDADDPKRVILGTDLGVYSSTDITAGSVEWSVEQAENEFRMLPIFDVDQQTLGHSEASNYGMLYFAAHGGGFWKSGTIVGIDQISHKDFGSSFESDIVIYPNPVQEVSRMKVTVSNPENAELYIYDINGQMRRMLNPSLEAGENDIELNVSELGSGTYFIRLNDGSTQKVAKFVKMK